MRTQAEAHLAALIESTDDLIWSVDLDFRKIVFNHALRENLEKNYGSRVEAGMRAEDDLPPERAAQWIPLYQRALHEGPYKIEYSLRDGRTLELAFNPIVENGKPVGISVFGKDISERKQAEAALAGSLELFRAITESSPLAIVLSLGSHEKLMYINPTFTKLFGYTLEEIPTVEEWWPLAYPDPEYREKVREEWQRRVSYAIANQSAIDPMEAEVACKDGTRKFVSWGFINRGDRNISFGVDLTEHKRVEEALRGSEELYRAITDSSPLAMVLLSGPEERVQYLNPTFTRLFGYTLEDMPTAAEWWPLAYPDPDYRRWIMAEWQRKVVRTFEDNSPFEPIEEEVTCKDGTTKTIKWGFLSIGERSLAFGLDRSSYKRAEMRLRDSEEQFRATFEQAAVGFVQASFEGVILRCNQQFAQILGYAREEVPGLTVEEITAPEARAETAAVLRRIRSEEAPSANFEKRFLRKDGSFVWARVTTSLQRSGAGRPLYFFAVVEDIQERKASEQRLAAIAESLRASETRYRIAFQTNLDSVDICYLEDGRFIDVNEAFVRCTGFTREEAVGHTALELGLWSDPQDRRKLVETMHRDAVCQNLEVQYRTKDGSLRWGLLSVSTIEINGAACILSITKDITEARAAEQRLASSAEALRLSEERYRTAFQTSFDAISLSHLDDGLYLDVNRAFLRLFDYQREEVVGRSSQELGIWADPLDRQEIVTVLRKESFCQNREMRARKKNGQIFWVLLSAVQIELEGVPSALFVIRDISAAKAAEEKIASLSYYDPLTNLPNRRLLLERLRKSLAASLQSHRKKALLIVDLDDFKTLNDTLGHPVGDLLLQEVGRRLLRCVHEGDTVARLGADEYAVLLEELSAVEEEAASQAQDVGERILLDIARTYTLGAFDSRCSASIGIAVFGKNEKNADEVLLQADIAMGQAKVAGRNTMRFFAPALQAAVNARATMEEDLRLAIGTYELKLCYQPQVRGSRVIGTEALLRWKHPLRGNISPAAFIPLAEETGLILPLGEWVLQSACRQIAAWEGNPRASQLTVSVNISARQLHQPDFVEQVLAVLDKTGANPKRLKLELTESMLVKNVEEVIAKMSRLKEHGLSFSLDDFGTGYSSLSYLKRLPLDELKIDLSFVRDLLADSSSGAIVETIVALCRAMGLTAIAEGVETVEQRAFLAGLGCHTYQGYLFSPALPLEEFERMFLGVPVIAASS
jgi:diguanylate cyclase (GGDEF)-like protein/PAS domain S-box-containing protein